MSKPVKILTYIKPHNRVVSNRLPAAAYNFLVTAAPAGLAFHSFALVAIRQMVEARE